MEVSVLHETCLEYFRRRLTEGWKCISLEGYNAVLLSPEGIRRELDLRNDVETLRPNAVGTYTQFGSQYPDSGEHWEKVDEESADGDTTYVEHYPTAGIMKDTFNIPASGLSGVVISSITVYVRCRVKDTVGTEWAKATIYTNSTLYYGSPESLGLSYVTYSKQWSTNPATGNPWTIAEIDALEIGVTLYRYYTPRCTQVYVEVDYTSVTERTSSDTGSGVDAYVSLETGEIKTSSDAGSGAEGIPMQSATLFGGETGSGIEAFVARLLAVFDTGTGAEVSGLLKDLFASEFGQGSDSFVAKIETPTKGGGMKLWI